MNVKGYFNMNIKRKIQIKTDGLIEEGIIDIGPIQKIGERFECGVFISVIFTEKRFFKGDDQIDAFYKAISFSRTYIKNINRDFHNGKCKKKILVFQEDENDNCNLDFPKSTIEYKLDDAIKAYYNETFLYEPEQNFEVTEELKSSLLNFLKSPSPNTPPTNPDP